MLKSCFKNFCLVIAMAAASLAAVPGCEKAVVGPVYPHGARPDDAKAVAISTHASGSHSLLTAPALKIVRTQAELNEIGDNAAKLAVDFDRQMVVLLALGTQPTSGYWAQITAIYQTQGVLWVEGIANRPEKSVVTQVQTSAYSAAVIDKIADVVLVSDIVSSVDQPSPGAAK